MFSTLLLDINKTLTNRILYKNKRPLQKVGVPRYCHYAKDSFCGRSHTLICIRSIRQIIIQLVDL